MEFKKTHHPPHIYSDNSIYFITARIYQKEKIFNTDQKKKILFENLWNEFSNIDYKLYSWVILDNHYHIEFKTKLGKNLGKVLNLIHGKTSFEINKLDNTRSRKIFKRRRKFSRSGRSGKGSKKFQILNIKCQILNFKSCGIQHF